MCDSREQECRVHTLSGTIVGLKNKDGICRFAGIPYAAPPVGKRRFRRPQSVTAWEGEKDCRKFAPCAYQMITSSDEKGPSPYGPEYDIRPEEIPSEDCLYLNVWVSETQLRPDALQPVLCIIHGGAFLAGSGGVYALDGTNLAEEGITVVTINYRMGVFGFLALQELGREYGDGLSGNYGIWDQIEALKWIRENIRTFGGDPDNVTIAGESAGAMSVSLLYTSSRARGLFHRAVAMSGSLYGKDCFVPCIRLPEAEEKGAALLRELGVTDAAALRACSTEQIYQASLKTGGFGYMPCVDDYLWLEDEEKVFRESRQNDVPVLLGMNGNEGSAFTDLFDERLSEKIFGYSTWRWARLISRYGSSDAYFYRFERVRPDRRMYGAFHGLALPYFYRNLQYAEDTLTEEDYRLQEVLSSCLVRFVRTGKQPLPAWNSFREDHSMVMRLGEKEEMIPNPLLERFCQYEEDDK